RGLASCRARTGIAPRPYRRRDASHGRRRVGPSPLGVAASSTYYFHVRLHRRSDRSTRGADIRDLPAEALHGVGAEFESPRGAATALARVADRPVGLATGGVPVSCGFRPRSWHPELPPDTCRRLPSPSAHPWPSRWILPTAA